jgi:predicted dehydrogenase
MNHPAFRPTATAILQHLGLLLFALLLPLRAEDIRIGLIGLDTSHVSAFLRIYNDAQSSHHVPGARIVAAYKGGSPDVVSSRTRIERFTQEASEKYGVELCASIEELARRVDAIMILSVDGRPHLEQFRRTLAAGKPVFIDKPFAGSLSDVLAIARLSTASHVPCFSTSMLRYTVDSPSLKLDEAGTVTSVYSFGPAETEPHHPDLYWYGIHAVEALYTVLGPGCVQLVRTHTEHTDVVTGIWADGRVGTVQGNRGTSHGYGVTVTGTKAIITGGQKTDYRPLAEAILKFFQTGVAPVSLDTTVEIYAFMEAADESKRRGGIPVSLTEVVQASRPAR